MRRSERAQSMVEFVGTLPLLALAATVCLQALLLALSVVFAQSAADRAARGTERAQVVSSIPAGWRDGAHITRRDDRVQVRIRTPAVLPGAGKLLIVRAVTEVAP